MARGGLGSERDVSEQNAFSKQQRLYAVCSYSAEAGGFSARGTAARAWSASGHVLHGLRCWLHASPRAVRTWLPRRGSSSTEDGPARTGSPAAARRAPARAFSLCPLSTPRYRAAPASARAVALSIVTSVFGDPISAIIARSRYAGALPMFALTPSRLLHLSLLETVNYYVYFAPSIAGIAMKGRCRCSR